MARLQLFKEEQRIKRNTKRRIGVVGFQVSLPMTHLPRLNHPHLVKALDFWQTGFEAAVVLSYHAGQALDVAVKDQTFSEGTSRTLFYQLISAVSYLHEQGVLHRDVKAENILVSPDHQKVYLADFNTAKALQDGGALTMTGTMEYAAPEVLDGNSPSYGQDVWGCGLCLHVMLTGRLPRRLHNFRSLEAFAAAQRSCPINWQHHQWNVCTAACKEVIIQCLCVKENIPPKCGWNPYHEMGFGTLTGLHCLIGRLMKLLFIFGLI